MKNGTQNPRLSDCPTCAQPGKALKAVTLQSLLRPEAKARMPAEADWHFCGNPDCPTVYFAGPADPVFAKGDLTVRVGIKEREAPRPICYCFNHTIEEIEDEIRRTGAITVLDDIKARMKEACWCETKSPRGSCCLSTVTRYVKAALEKQGKSLPACANTPADGCVSGRHSAHETVPDCCASAGPPANDAARLGVPSSGGSTAAPAEAGTPNVGRLSLFGGLLAALLASACCWLPLLLLAFGVSGAAVSATFAQYRPLFLGLTFALLAAAFYFAYRPTRAVAAGTHQDSEGCCAQPAPAGACCAPAGGTARGLQRFNRIMLWLVTVLALAFAFFPNYVGTLVGGNSRAPLAPDLEQIVLKVEGMDCPACATALERQLKTVPGVADARVDYDEKQAVIGFREETEPPTEAVRQAIAEAGFHARLQQTGRRR